MAAPFIIPFNNQPVQTVATTANYTVPAGKYSRVCISNTIAPLLNSAVLYESITHTGVFTIGVTTQVTMVLAMNCRRVTFGFTSLISGLYTSFGPTVSTSIYHKVVSSGTTLQFVGDLKGGTQISFIYGAASTQLTSITYETNTLKNELWLKAGDVISYSSGYISYSEYNIIS